MASYFWQSDQREPSKLFHVLSFSGCSLTLLLALGDCVCGLELSTQR